MLNKTFCVQNVHKKSFFVYISEKGKEKKYERSLSTDKAGTI